MKSSSCFLLLLPLFLAACGGPRPTGTLKECVGSTSIQEEGSESLALAITSGNRLGQFVSLAAGTTITGLMIKAAATGLTGVRINIYSGGQIGYDPSAEPRKQYVINKTVTTNGTEDLWFQLPESYTLPELPSGGGTDSEYYFISFEPLGGTLTPKVGFGNPNTGLRRGSRYGSTIQWSLSDSSMAFNMGYQTPNDCQTN